MEKELENEIWRTAFFVFDTSALLNLHEFSDRTFGLLFINVFDKLKNRLWLPYNVNSEYSKNREKPTAETLAKYEELKGHMDKILQNLDQIKNKTKFPEKHPHVDPEITGSLDIPIGEYKKALEKEIEAKKHELKKKSDNGVVDKQIFEYFEVGKPYEYSRTIEIIKEGEFRYRNSIPPGYKDEAEKIGFSKYGDLIIWKQILDKAGEIKKNIILVTDEKKEDWWLHNKSKGPQIPLTPRVELVNEFESTTKQNFWMYSTADFFAKANEIIQANLDAQTMQEVNSVGHTLSYKIIDGVRLDATQHFDESWRIDRLVSVLNYFKERKSAHNLLSLYDHKGTLTVGWKHEPTSSETVTIENAWENQNEMAEFVNHEIEHE